MLDHNFLPQLLGVLKEQNRLIALKNELLELRPYYVRADRLDLVHNIDSAIADINFRIGYVALDVL